MTVGGADPNKPCIFPFKQFHGHKTHDACILDPWPWCSTKVNDEGIHIAGQGNWGNCDQSKCPMPGAGEY